MRVQTILTLAATLCAATGAGQGRTDSTATGGSELTIERIYADPPITGAAPSRIAWRPDSRAVSFLIDVGEGDAAERHFVVAEVPKGKRETLWVVDTTAVPDDLRAGEDDRFSLGAYAWAKSGDFIAFAFAGEVFTFHPESREVIRRTRSQKADANVTISPDGRTISFTREHDLFVLDVESGSERALTTSGSDSLLNGVLDWLYMEELFTRGDVQGYWWSPDGRKIAYLQIDESPVRTFPIVDFVPQYNTAEMQHYPKAGSDNPIVRVGAVDVESGETTWMGVDTGDDGYIARVNWVGDSEHLAIEKLNRNQDELRLYFADVASGEAREVLRESKASWINVTYAKHFYQRKDQFIWSAELDGHRHLYLYENDGSLVRQLTSGPWEVTSLDDVDERRGEIFFTANNGATLERHLFAVSERRGSVDRITEQPGTHNITFSPDHRYYFDRFSDVRTPRVISVNKSNGDRLFVLDAFEGDAMARYALPETEFMTVTSPEGREFHCSIMKPSGFDAATRYPVIVYVYGGPHRQVVRNVWGGTRHLWHAYMAQQGYVIFSLDNRGSFGRGSDWEDPLLKRMGHVELEDQLAGVEYLKSLPWVDPSRIAIWGWSYGAYVTSMAMFKAPGVFKCGAAVAPVTDWRFYDTIYTERYMKRPQDNEEGYEASAPINFVDGLEAPFFLAHGTADDNVHMANTIRLVNELINEGKDFELMLYPRKLHGIRGRAARVHLYTRLTKFFEDNI